MKRYHSSLREPSAFNGNDQETQRQRQIRNYHERGGSRRNQAVRHAALMFGAPDAQRQRYPPGKKHGRYRQKQSISRANQQQRRHGAVKGKRKSHVAAEHRTHPVEVAHRQGPVHFILGFKRGDGFRSNLRV